MVASQPKCSMIDAHKRPVDTETFVGNVTSRGVARSDQALRPRATPDPHARVTMPVSTYSRKPLHKRPATDLASIVTPVQGSRRCACDGSHPRILLSYRIVSVPMPRRRGSRRTCVPGLRCSRRAEAVYSISFTPQQMQVRTQDLCLALCRDSLDQTDPV